MPGVTGQPLAVCQPSQSNPAACPPRPALPAKKAMCRMPPLPKVIWLFNRHCQTCQPIKATYHMPTKEATCRMPANKATCRMPSLPNQFGLVNGTCQSCQMNMAARPPRPTLSACQHGHSYGCLPACQTPARSAIASPVKSIGVAFTSLPSHMPPASSAQGTVARGDGHLADRVSVGLQNNK